jgi:hypothetical protein
MANGRKSPRGRSAFRANVKSTKAKNSDYEKKIGAIRARAPVGELVDFQFLFTNFPDTFPKGRPHFAELFLADAKRKEHLREDGRLAPWEKVKDDPVSGASASPSVSAESFDSGTVTVVKLTDYSVLRLELYTRGIQLRSKEEVSAATLQARGGSFSKYTRGALGNFLVWLQDQGELEPFNGKKRRFSALGFKEQGKMASLREEVMPLPFAPKSPSGDASVSVAVGADVSVPEASPSEAPPAAIDETTVVSESAGAVADSTSAIILKPEAETPPDAVEPAACDDEVEVLVAPVARPKRAPNDWDLLRHEKTDRQFAPLVHICERLGITSLAAATVRRVFREFHAFSTEKILIVRIGQLATGGRVFRSSPEKGRGTHWFRDDYLEAVRSGRFDEVPSPPLEVEASEAEVTVVEGDELAASVDEALPLLDAPEPPASESVEPIVEPALEVAPPPSSGVRRVLIRHSSLVPRHIHDANLAELRATRAATEALQAQIEGLPDQLRGIVQEALRCQAEDFERQLAAERGQREALQAQLVELRQQHNNLVAGLADEGEAEYNEVEDLRARVAVMESQLEAVGAFKKLLAAFAAEVK